MKIHIISATRMNETDFWKQSALGQSLQRVRYDNRLSPIIRTTNSLGLPLVYNAAIDAVAADDIVVFIHDDVWLDDYFIGQRILEGIQSFDAIGVAGNTRRSPQQPAWAFKEIQQGRFIWDQGFLSGVVAHGPDPFGTLSVFGFSPQPCELVDGVFIAANVSALRKHNIRFDEQFDFHFYDMDFCRSVRKQGLALGTWPVALTHQSGGAFGTPAWQAMFERYLAKWGN